MRTHRHSNLPCDHCGETSGSLVITDARPLITDEIGIFEANPQEPKLCDDCDTARAVRRWYAENPEMAQQVYCAPDAASALRLMRVRDWQAKEQK